MHTFSRRAFAIASVLAACTSGGGEPPQGVTDTASGSETGSSGEASEATGSSAGTSSSDATGSSAGEESSDSSSGESGTTTEPPAVCEGADPERAVACDDDAEPGSFAAAIEWTWAGDAAAGEVRVSSTPLVVNLTDDNDDGVVDPCDVPDVVVVAHEDVDWANPFGEAWSGGHVWILDGATGAPHARIDDRVWWAAQPAAADLDGDGVPEIVAVGNLQDDGHLRAWRADGTPLETWTPSQWGWQWRWLQAPTIVDLERQGSPAVVIGERITSHDGEWIATLPHSVLIDSEGTQRLGNTSVVDLDADGAPEILVGRHAYTWRDDWYWPYYDETGLGDVPGFSQVGDLDGDGALEVVLTHVAGVSVLDGDGSVLVGPVLPVESIAGPQWRRPAAIMDLDGDGAAEIAMAAADRLVVLRLVTIDGTTSLVVSAEWVVEDAAHAYAKLAAPTIFDLDGDGAPEILYGDAGALLVLDPADPTAPPLVEIERSSRLELETPVVADVDGDGAAEILVVSSEDGAGIASAPPLRLVGDPAWVGARRIWNQHAYRVVDVHEDGSVPAEPSLASPLADGFRVNARVEGGVLCEG